MAPEYLVHLPDGSEYGPVDRATLVAWREEGRLPIDALVWPEGAPAWLRVDEALGDAPPPVVSLPPPEPAAAGPGRRASDPALPAAGAPSPRRASDPNLSVAPAAKGTAPRLVSPSVASSVVTSASDTIAPPARAGLRTSGARPAAAPPPAKSPAPSRAFLLGVSALALVVAVSAAGLYVLRPWLAKRAEVAAVKSHALPDRRIELGEAGLVAELPPSWVALRPANPYVTADDARLRLAAPAVPVFAAVRVVVRPAQMDALDVFLDDLLRDRVPQQPSMKAGGRADVQLGRGKGRLVRTTWEENLVAMQGETVAWADGYDIFTLEAQAPAAAGAHLSEEVASLCRGLSATGVVEGRLSEAVERLSIEVPELSREALRLLVAERLSQGRDLADVPREGLRLVSRGLDALGPGEAAEMRSIYQQVWAPVPEADRVRSAALLAAIKDGQSVPDDAVATLRAALKTGILALPADQRARLQELSSRALRQSQQPR